MKCRPGRAIARGDDLALQVVSSRGGSIAGALADLATSNSAMARVTDRFNSMNAGSEGSTSPDLSIRSSVALRTLIRVGQEAADII